MSARDGETAEPCTRPPVGWLCTRGAHIDGPCAAVPDARFVPAAAVEQGHVNVHVDGRAVDGLVREQANAQSDAHAADGVPWWVRRDSSQQTWRTRAADLEEQLRDLAKVFALQNEQLWAIITTAGAEPLIGSQVVDEVRALVERGAAREAYLRALVTRWQGYANEMADLRDDTARLVLAAKRETEQVREALREAREAHAASVRFAAEIGTKLRARNNQLYRALAPRVLLEVDLRVIGVKVHVEHQRLYLTRWVKLGGFSRGWLRSW